MQRTVDVARLSGQRSQGEPHLLKRSPQVTFTPLAERLLSHALVVMMVFAYMAIAGDPAPGDRLFAAMVQAPPSGSLLATAGNVLRLPGGELVALFAAILVAIVLRRGQLACVGLLLLAALVMNPLVREIVARPHPVASQLVIRRAANGPAFPSADVTQAALIYGYLALALTQLLSQRSFATVVLGACWSLAVLLVAWECVYDGVNWPSDVAAACVLGMLELAACAWMSSRLIPLVRTAVEASGRLRVKGNAHSIEDHHLGYARPRRIDDPT